MHYHRLLHTVVQVATAAVIFANSAFAATVNFPDSATRDAVLHSLNGHGFSDNPITTVTASAMAGLTDLREGPNSGEISDLTGLELASNLRYVTLGRNSITGLTPLAGLTFMAGVALFDNQITDLAPLRNLTAVTNLALYKNDIQDLTPLANMSAMGSLNISHNRIVSLGPLGNMTAMTRLDVSSNMIADLTPLQNLTALRYLQLGHNQITNLQSLKNLDRIEELTLSGNPDLRLGTLPGMSGLRWLIIEDGLISDISALGRDPSVASSFPFPLLSSITLNDNMITDLSPLANNHLFRERRGGLSVENNPLSQRSIDYHIPTLQKSGVTVKFTAGARITSVSIASTPLLGTSVVNTYGVDETIQVEISFDAPVTVTGTPQLTLTIGSVERRASYTSGSGGTSLTFSYEVQSTDSDADGIAVGAPALMSNDPDITGTGGYRISLNLGRYAIAPNPDHKVDGGARFVHVPDANLRAALEAALSKTSGETITGADIASLTDLYAPGVGITDLSGLEYAIGLKRLWLLNNSIEDLTPLAGLSNLTWLDLCNNSIKDTGPLAGLSNLTRLDIRGNQLATIKPLENLTGLMVLRLYNNSITDIAPLAGMTGLQELGLGGNRISDLESLRDMTDLRLLDLRDNQVSNLSPLAGMTKLTSLGLANNLITDIAPLITNTGLGEGVEIDLRGNRLSWDSIRLHYRALGNLGVSVVIGTDVTIPDANLRAALEGALGKASGEAITDVEMATLTDFVAINMNIVDLTGMEFAVGVKRLIFLFNEIQSLTPLAGLRELVELNVTRNPIKDIVPLANLTGLRRLNLSRTPIDDLTPLANMTSLKVLILGASMVTDFTSLRGLTSLTELAAAHDIHRARRVTTPVSLAGMANMKNLRIEHYPLTDLSFAAGMPGLVTLALEGAQITDLTPLTRLTSLEQLSIRKNGRAISDFTPLAGLSKMSLLSLPGSSITDLTFVSGMADLDTLGVSDNSITDLTPLTGLTSLRQLVIENNQIENLAPLAGLLNLSLLRLRNNLITDISPLVENTGLGVWDAPRGYRDHIYINSNPLNPEALSIHIPALRSRSVNVFH